MIDSEKKDRILAEIKAGRFIYKRGLHEEVIKELDSDGLLDISRTKDGTDVDLTPRGKTFISEGGYEQIEKKKAKEKRTKQISKALKWIIVTIVAAFISGIIGKLTNLL